MEREKINIGRLVFENILFFLKARAIFLDFVWSFLEGTKKKKEEEEEEATF